MLKRRERVCKVITFRPFLTEIPDKCFISAEAVDWCCGRVEGVNSVDLAVNLLQRLLDEGYVRHVGNNATFLFGVFFYCVVDDQKNSGKGIEFCNFMVYYHSILNSQLHPTTENNNNQQQ